jgi:hypothetical protein
MAYLHPDLVSRALRLSQDNPQDLVSVYSLNNDTCLFASPSHLEIMGYSYLDMLGQNWRVFVAGEDQSHTELAGTDAILMGSSIEFGLNILAKSGALVAVRAVAWTEIDPESGWKFLFFQAHPRNQACMMAKPRQISQ